MVDKTYMVNILDMVDMMDIVDMLDMFYILDNRHGGRHNRASEHVGYGGHHRHVTYG